MVDKLKLQEKYTKLRLQLRRFAWNIRYKALPFVWWLSKPVIIGVVIATAVIFTKYGFESHRSDEHKELFGVLVGTIGTVLAVFFSLILLPLNQVSSKYSPSFLRYLKRDSFFIAVLAYACGTLAYSVIFLLTGANRGIAISAVTLFLFLFLLLISSWRHVITLSNPLNSVLIPVHNDIVKKFRKAIPKARKQRAESLKQLSDASSKTGVDLTYFQIDSSITNYIQEQLVPLQGVALRAIKDLELEQAKNAIQVMASVIINYLGARVEYYSDDDPLMYFIYTEFKSLTNAADKAELKLKLHPFIVECWKSIGVNAARVNVKKMRRLQDKTNGLVVYPVKALFELCSQNLMEMDSYAPGKACEALGDIGVTLMSEGYDLQAAHIVEDLEKISLVAEKVDVGVHAGSANRAIMRIYGAGMVHRNDGSKDALNYPYTIIHKSISNLLNSFLQKNGLLLMAKYLDRSSGG